MARRRRPRRPEGFVPGHDHGALGFHRTGRNTYRKGKRQYQRVKGGFAPIPRRPRPGFDPLQPLTGRAFSRELDAATRLRYGPQERELAGERRISDAQTRNIGDWYGQYLADVDRARQQVQAGYQQAQTGIYNQANTAATQDEQQRRQQQQEAAQSAQNRGAAPSADVDRQAQQAAQARRALSSSFGGMVGTVGANQNAYMSKVRTAGAGARVGALEDEAKRRRQIERLARDLAREKGDFRATYRADAREKERTYALNRQAFGLQVAKANQQAAYQQGQLRNVRHGQNLVASAKRADRRLRARLKHIDQAIAQGNLSERHRHNLQTERTSLINALRPRSGGRGGGGISPSKARSYRDSWEKTVDGYRRFGDNYTQKGANVPPLIRRAAIEYLRNRGKGVSRTTARRVRHRYGFHIRVVKNRGSNIFTKVG